MPKYLIERDISGASLLTEKELQSIAQKSMCAMEHIRDYTWHETFVAGDKFYCVHAAPNAEAVREHSRRGGFPITQITEIAATISPATAGAPTVAEV